MVQGASPRPACFVLAGVFHYLSQPCWPSQFLLPLPFVTHKPLHAPLVVFLAGPPRKIGGASQSLDALSDVFGGMFPQCPLGRQC